jgi:hypothetical protein
MSSDSDTIMRHIHTQWHAAVISRDLAGLMTLYAEDAVFESPLVWATLKTGTGILNGRTAISDFFAAGFRTPGNGLGRWYRTGLFFANGRVLTWEYPRETPDGDQIDLVEVMEVADGLIRHHRVYWGWVGCKTLCSLPA